MASPLRAPALLRADNFTPRVRTPWGGTRIAERLKSAWVLAGTVIGESWEVSIEPSFPSLLVDGTELAAALEADPKGALGREARAGRVGTALLVKLLDAADNLSLQIHPTDDYPGLASDEAGKPEAWYVVQRDPGSGIYLGLREGVTPRQMKACLDGRGDVSELLFHVPVQPGDFFLVEAGTAHAVGRGITLVEPQHVLPGKRGVTYRYWDWNRLYDQEGRVDERGEPRNLDLDDALKVTAWDAPRELALLDRIRMKAGLPSVDGPPTLEPLSGPEGRVASAFLAVARLHGHGALDLPDDDGLRAMTVLEGSLTISTSASELRVDAGRSAVIPACARGLSVHLDHCCTITSRVLCPGGQSNV